MSEGSPKPHILMVSQVFYPEVFRSNDLAAEWVKRGYKVTVLTGIPNYPKGEFFEGYDRKHKRTETWNGVEIIHVPVVPRGHSSINLVRNYFSFVRYGKRWVRKNNVHADLVFNFETSPMTQTLVAIMYGRKYHVPVFLYAQDLWPENVEAITGIHNPLVIGRINRMVDYIYKWSDEIFATSPSFVKAITGRKKPVDVNKVHYWPQYAEEFYQPVAAPSESDIPHLNDVIQSKAFKIAFTGNIGMAQGLDVLPRAAELLSDKNVLFVIVGDGRYREKFEEEIRNRKVEDKFILIPRQPAERIPEILACCDAGFISFSNLELWENTIPAKLQSYMACGKAIIASASGETGRVVDEAECGICTKTGDAEALSAAVSDLLSLEPDMRDETIQRMGRNGRAYFESHFRKKDLMDEMDRYIRAVIK